ADRARGLRPPARHLTLALGRSSDANGRRDVGLGTAPARGPTPEDVVELEPAAARDVPGPLGRGGLLPRRLRDERRRPGLADDDARALPAHGRARRDRGERALLPPRARRGRARRRRRPPP